MKKIVLLFVALSLAAFGAPVTQKNISLEDAQKIVAVAIREAKNEKVNVSVVILDRAGNIKLSVVDDNAGIHTLDTSKRKAFTALTFKVPTSEFAKRVEKNPALLQISETISLPGGVPIKIGNEVIGSIGIGGAPSGDIDEKIANAAILEIIK